MLPTTFVAISLRAAALGSQVPDVDVVVGLGDAPCVWYDAEKNDAQRRRSRGTVARVADAVRAKIANYVGENRFSPTFD